LRVARAIFIFLSFFSFPAISANFGGAAQYLNPKRRARDTINLAERLNAIFACRGLLFEAPIQDAAANLCACAAPISSRASPFS
jgi:hypothetical protein